MQYPKDNFIFGLRPVIEAIESGKEIEKVFLQTNLTSAVAKDLQRLLRENNILFQYVPLEKLKRITSKNHQGVVAYVSEITYQKIEDILPFLFEKGKIPLILLLDEITDVRNMGAIVRTAECAGADAVVIPQKRLCPYQCRRYEGFGRSTKHIAGLPRKKSCRYHKFLARSQGCKYWHVTKKPKLLTPILTLPALRHS